MVGYKMTPARAELTSSFSITDTANEVVCPLPNQDGSNCRKRCIGEKRYRSMQEHIRRAHPEYYIPKLPATEASFVHMVNSSPRKRPDPEENSAVAAQSFRSHYDSSTPATPRHSDEYSTTPGNHNPSLGTATAAAVLAELHGIKSERDIDMDGGYHSDVDRRIPRSSIELPPIHQLSNADITSDPYSRRELFPPMLSGSPPGRSSTLPPLHQATGPNRPRTHSVTKRGRDSQHKKKNSRGAAADFIRRAQNDGRKAMSAEPSGGYGTNRWNDLIAAADQAASAAGDVDEDRTPMPQSPVSIQRGSIPPFSGPQVHTSSYQASPLQQALTPPSNNADTVEPFPSVESSASGENFHMGAHGLNDSSPTYSSHNIQIYCAACRSISYLKNSYACTECICGFCSTCVEVMMAEQGARRKCPHCATIGGRFKPFQLEIR